jgi:predicted dehydrogenase
MNERQRAVLVGCGSMSREWLKALRQHDDSVEVVGLVDLVETAAVARAQEFDLSLIWTGSSLDEALRATRPALVFNCTIPEAHVETCMTALRAGCHVLVEKPLAPTVKEAKELARLAHEMGRTFAVIQNRRYLPGAIAVRDAIGDPYVRSMSAVPGPKCGAGHVPRI